MSDTLPSYMKGVVLTGHGGPEKLEWRDQLPVPKPGPYDVVIKVGAAGVNNTDLNTRTAWYSKGNAASEDATWAGKPMSFPRIQGADVCGRIVAVGGEVEQSRIGERVLIEPCLTRMHGENLEVPAYFGSECDGGFAEYSLVDTMHAHKINSRYSDGELASFPCSYSTAENMLTRAFVTSKDTVLVTGASGGVGSAAVQLAKARGARVLAVASAEKMHAIGELGASAIFKRNADLVEAIGMSAVDVIVDLVAGSQWPSLLDILRPGGRYTVAGAIGGSDVRLDVRTLYLKDLTLFGCTVLEPGVFERLIDYIEAESIQPIVAEKFALRDLVAAQNAFLKKHHVGKLVVEPNDCLAGAR